jgi:hypothetical protein
MTAVMVQIREFAPNNPHAAAGERI